LHFEDIVTLKSLACLVAATLLFSVAAETAALAQNVSNGADSFDANCGDCHSVKAGKNKKGPSLAGLVGRHAGTVPGQDYSPANKSSNLVWTPDVLTRYLANPQAVIPGTTMKFKGLKDPKEIADLVAFLEQQK
jgi:cytochrome c